MSGPPAARSERASRRPPAARIERAPAARIERAPGREERASHRPCRRQLLRIVWPADTDKFQRSLQGACGILSEFSGSDSDTHKRVSTKSNPGFLERLSDTVGGTAVGIGLFFLSIYVLFTNEGRALQTASSLDEGLSQVVSLVPSFGIDQQNNHRLVHLSAELHTSQPLHDPNYRVVVQAVKLKRQVEMYQWVEYHESKDYQENGETKTETTYTYNTEWKSEVINSRNFDKEIGHQNPSAMAVESVTVVAPEARVGRFLLSKGLVEKINNFQTLSLRDFQVDTLDSFLTIDDDYFYHTSNPRRPEVGDVRVRFSFAGLSGEASHLGPAQIVSAADDPEVLRPRSPPVNGSRRPTCRSHDQPSRIKVSVVAMQRDEHLVPFKTKSGDTLEILHLGELTAQEVFEREHQHNSMKTWGLRAAGWALMFLSIQLITRIIHTLVDWVPVLRELVSMGLKLFALCISCSLSLLTIAAGWLFYRPLVAMALGALALLPVLISRSQLPSKKNQ